MVQSGRVDLLMHPLTQKFLQMKWHAYGMYIHLLNMFLYLLFLTMVTLFAASIMKPNPFNQETTLFNSSLIAEEKNASDESSALQVTSIHF